MIFTTTKKRFSLFCLCFRSGRSNEPALVKRLSETYAKCVREMIGLRSYDGPFTFKDFEKYLYSKSLKRIFEDSFLIALVLSFALDVVVAVVQHVYDQLFVDLLLLLSNWFCCCCLVRLSTCWVLSRVGLRKFGARAKKIWGPIKLFFSSFICFSFQLNLYFPSKYI